MKLQQTLYLPIIIFCLPVQLKILTARIKLAASNFAPWIISILGRQSPIWGNFAHPEAPPKPKIEQMGQRTHTKNVHGLCTLGGLMTQPSIFTGQLQRL